ncbi:hypothetical protein AURDEDRAFT_36166, partial [Auricularia subglabra TFB-10046 SS5]
SVQLLVQIANTLSGNRTTQIPAPSTSALSDSSAARINTYWFCSLVLSLSAALVGILSKQWIREYERDAGRTHKDMLSIRQMKFQGLETWRIDDIIPSIPLLLQGALALFLVGILELLWQLRRSVALPVTILAAAIALFYLTTSILPSAHLLSWYFTRASLPAPCPYKSPQAWLVIK